MSKTKGKLLKKSLGEDLINMTRWIAFQSTLSFTGPMSVYTRVFLRLFKSYKCSVSPLCVIFFGWAWTKWWHTDKNRNIKTSLMSKQTLKQYVGMCSDLDLIYTFKIYSLFIVFGRLQIAQRTTGADFHFWLRIENNKRRHLFTWTSCGHFQLWSDFGSCQASRLFSLIILRGHLKQNCIVQMCDPSKFRTTGSKLFWY